MPIYSEYTTVDDLRGVDRGSIETGQDALYLDLIRSTSKEIDDAAHRRFYPRVETYTYNTPEQTLGPLRIDDLLEITTLTNGDATVITSSKYKLYPLNYYPKREIRLLTSQGTVWQLSTGGDREGAISVLGVWGHHDDYAGNAWLDTKGILTAAIATTSVITFTCTVGTVKEGYILKIDSEYLYPSKVETGSGNDVDTVTCVRGINGSTAATHVNASLIYRWYVPEIERLCRTATQAYINLNDNPLGNTVNVGGTVFETPKDVNVYIQEKLRRMGLVRMDISPA